jgi:hypothetical protein
MKQLYLLVLLIVTSTLAPAQSMLHLQDSTILLSGYEQYCTTPGKLIKTFTRVIGEVRSASIEVLTTTDIRKGDSVSVVRITSPAWYTTTNPLIAVDNLYFSKEELGNIINVLQYYNTEIKNGNVISQNSYSYITDNDVKISCEYEEGIFNNYWLRLRKIYHNLRTPAMSGYSFGKRDVEELIKLLQTAQKTL